YRSLKPELERWRQVLHITDVNGAFNPGQIFSRRYIQSLLSLRQYRDISDLVEENQSFTLHEVLLPTLAEVMRMRVCPYPLELDPTIRYRPYQGISGIKRALTLPDAYFVHPVRR